MRNLQASIASLRYYIIALYSCLFCRISDDVLSAFQRYVEQKHFSHCKLLLACSMACRWLQVLGECYLPLILYPPAPQLFDFYHCCSSVPIYPDWWMADLDMEWHLEKCLQQPWPRFYPVRGSVAIIQSTPSSSHLRFGGCSWCFSRTSFQMYSKCCRHRLSSLHGQLLLLGHSPALSIPPTLGQGVPMWSRVLF